MRRDLGDDAVDALGKLAIVVGERGDRLADGLLAGGAVLPGLLLRTQLGSALLDGVPLLVRQTCGLLSHVGGLPRRQRVHWRASSDCRRSSLSALVSTGVALVSSVILRTASVR